MIEYKSMSYKESDEKWVRDLVQELTAGIMIDETKLERISEFVRAEIEGNVYGQKEYLGADAAPNAPATIAKKGHGVVFYETGEMRKSIAEKRISTIQREVYVKPGRSLIATFLQYGTSRMPARPFFGISDETLTKIQNIILNKT